MNRILFVLPEQSPQYIQRMGPRLRFLRTPAQLDQSLHAETQPGRRAHLKLGRDQRLHHEWYASAASCGTQFLNAQFGIRHEFIVHIISNDGHKLTEPFHWSAMQFWFIGAPHSNTNLRETNVSLLECSAMLRFRQQLLKVCSDL